MDSAPNPGSGGALPNNPRLYLIKLPSGIGPAHSVASNNFVFGEFEILTEESRHYLDIIYKRVLA